MSKYAGRGSVVMHFDIGEYEAPNAVEAEAIVRDSINSYISILAHSNGRDAEMPTLDSFHVDCHADPVRGHGCKCED